MSPPIKQSAPSSSVATVSSPETQTSKNKESSGVMSKKDVFRSPPNSGNGNISSKNNSSKSNSNSSNAKIEGSSGRVIGMLVDRSSFDETEDFHIHQHAVQLQSQQAETRGQTSTVLRNGKVRRRMRWRPKRTKEEGGEDTAKGTTGSEASENSMSTSTSSKSTNLFGRAAARRSQRYNSNHDDDNMSLSSKKSMHSVSSTQTQKQDNTHKFKNKMNKQKPLSASNAERKRLMPPKPKKTSKTPSSTQLSTISGDKDVITAVDSQSAAQSHFEEDKNDHNYNNNGTATESTIPASNDNSKKSTKDDDTRSSTPTTHGIPPLFGRTSKPKLSPSRRTSDEGDEQPPEKPGMGKPQAPSQQRRWIQNKTINQGGTIAATSSSKSTSTHILPKPSTTSTARQDDNRADEFLQKERDSMGKSGPLISLENGTNNKPHDNKDLALPSLAEDNDLVSQRRVDLRIPRSLSMSSHHSAGSSGRRSPGLRKGLQNGGQIANSEILDLDDLSLLQSDDEDTDTEQEGTHATKARAQNKSNNPQEQDLTSNDIIRSVAEPQVSSSDGAASSPQLASSSLVPSTNPLPPPPPPPPHPPRSSARDELRFSMSDESNSQSKGAVTAASKAAIVSPPRKQQAQNDQEKEQQQQRQHTTPTSVPVDLDDGTFLEAEKNLQAIHEIGIEHLRHAEFSEALEVFEEILRGQLTRYGKDHPRVGTALHNIALVHMKKGDYREAVRVCREAVRVREVALGKDHTDLAVSLAQLGVAYLELKRHKKAIVNFRSALKIRRKAFGPKHPKVAKILNNIGCSLYELTELEVAMVAFEEALEIQRETLRATKMTSSPVDLDDDPLTTKISKEKGDTTSAVNQVLLSIASTLCNIGSIKLYWGLFDEASIDLEEALLIQASVLGDEHALSRRTMESLQWIENQADAAREGYQGGCLLPNGIDGSRRMITEALPHMGGFHFLCSGALPYIIEEPLETGKNSEDPNSGYSTSGQGPNFAKVLETTLNFMQHATSGLLSCADIPEGSDGHKKQSQFGQSREESNTKEGRESNSLQHPSSSNDNVDFSEEKKDSVGDDLYQDNLQPVAPLSSPTKQGPIQQEEEAVPDQMHLSASSETETDLSIHDDGHYWV